MSVNKKFICECGSEVRNDKFAIQKHKLSKKHIRYCTRDILPKVENNKYYCICGSVINNTKNSIISHQKNQKHFKYVNNCNFEDYQKLIADKLFNLIYKN